MEDFLRDLITAGKEMNPVEIKFLARVANEWVPRFDEDVIELPDVEELVDQSKVLAKISKKEKL